METFIEAVNKEEIELLNTQIRDNCGDHVEENVHKRRDP